MQRASKEKNGRWKRKGESAEKGNGRERRKKKENLRSD